MKATGIALTATTISLAAAPAVQAGVAVPRDFAGLSDWGWPTAQQATKIGQDGIGTFRAGLAWEWVEARQGQRAWGGVDDLMTKASANNYELVLVLNGCTVWACGKTRTAPQTPEQRRWFQEYVTDAVSRYGQGGSFWRSRSGLAPVKVSWQVFNEVNVGADWPNPTVAAYADLLAETSATIKGVDPSATVVTAGLAELPAVPEGAPLSQFLEGLEQIASFKVSADVVAVHGYAEDARGTARVLDTARRIMLDHGDQRPLWITELGWGSGGPAHPFVRTPEGQAAELRSAFDMLTACRDRWDVSKAIWFALRDVQPHQLGEGDYWGMHTGIYGADGVTEKPAAAALREYAGGRELPEGRATSCPLAGGNTKQAAVDAGRGPAVTVVQAPRYVGSAALAGKNGVARAKIDFVTDMGDRGRAECSLNGGAFEPCATPYVIPRSAEGRHELRIRGVDVGGVVSRTPAVASWTVDVTAPRTTFRKRPPRRSKSRVVKVKVAALGATRAAVGPAEQVTFQCSLNRRKWARCAASGKVRATRRGKQQLRVRAVDAAGNVDPRPITAKFTVTR